MRLGSAGYGCSAATMEMVACMANICRWMKVTTMGLRKGDIATVVCEGPSKEELIDVLYQHFQYLI